MLQFVVLIACFIAAFAVDSDKCYYVGDCDNYTGKCICINVIDSVKKELAVDFNGFEYEVEPDGVWHDNVDKCYYYGDCDKYTGNCICIGIVDALTTQLTFDQQSEKCYVATDCDTYTGPCICVDIIDSVKTKLGMPWIKESFKKLIKFAHKFTKKGLDGIWHPDGYLDVDKCYKFGDCDDYSGPCICTDIVNAVTSYMMERICYIATDCDTYTGHCICTDIMSEVKSEKAEIVASGQGNIIEVPMYAIYFVSALIASLLMANITCFCCYGRDRNIYGKVHQFQSDEEMVDLK